MTEPGSLLDAQVRLRQHVLWFVRMRWLAAAVSLALTLVAVPYLEILPAATLPPLLAWCGLLVGANSLFSWWARKGRFFARQIVVQATVDLVILTGLLNSSGGIENPLFIVYLFHVIIPGILLPRKQAFALMLIACILFSVLVLGEFFQVLPHYTIVLFPHAQREDLKGSHEEGQEGEPEPGEEEPVEHDSTGPVIVHASHQRAFVVGRGLPFLVVLALTSYFTTLVAERLRRTEGELEELARHAMLEHERLVSVVDAARVGIMLLTPEVRVRWFSQRAADWLGWARSVLSKRCPLDGASGGCPDCIVARTVEEGMALESERTEVAEGGGLRYFRHATSPVRDADGGVVQVVELVEDITDRKALEAEALHAGKLSVLGRMAAGIAHEIGNPLSSLDARLHLMEKREDPDFFRESIGILRGQIGRIERIVRGISQFSRGGSVSWTIWEVNAVLEEALNVVRLDRRAKNIRFQTEFASPSPRVRGVKDQISQVFVNILLNAVQILPDRGSILVQTRQQGHEVHIAVADTGPGMDHVVLGKIFEPFFTTKSDGTGLGLAISYSFVHAHGGTIDVDSEQGRGSKFTVVLPAATPAKTFQVGRK